MFLSGFYIWVMWPQMNLEVFTIFLLSGILHMKNSYSSYRLSLISLFVVSFFSSPFGLIELLEMIPFCLCY